MPLKPRLAKLLQITVTATDPGTNTTGHANVHRHRGRPDPNSRAFISQFPYPTQVVTSTPGSPTQPAVVYTQNVAENQKNIFQIPAVDPRRGQADLRDQGGSDHHLGGSILHGYSGDPATATVDQNTGVVTVTPAQGFKGLINMLVGVRDQTNWSTSGEALGLSFNFNYHQIIMNVGGATPVALTPIALPVNQTVAAAKLRRPCSSMASVPTPRPRRG